MEESHQSKGGRKRAERLSPEERRNIARQGAIARWNRLELQPGQTVPKSVASGILPLGEIPCAVLDDPENTRVLTQSGFLRAVGRFPYPKSAGSDRLAQLPAFLRAKNLEPFISSDLIASSAPIVFDTRAGGSLALGFKAQLLPKVCWVYHEAEMRGALLPGQRHIAEACTILLKGLTNVAIDSLVDEATGFQDIRAKDALIRLLEKYVRAEAAPWVKTFDDDFYKEMFRLHGYKYDPASVKRPLIFAKRTEDIYDRLAPAVRKELQAVVKRGPDGRPSEKLFQHLSPDGQKHLNAHLEGVKALMRASVAQRDFQRLLDRIYPRFGDTIQIPFVDQE